MEGGNEREAESVVVVLGQQQAKHSGQQNGRSRGSDSSGKSGGNDSTQQ